MTDRPPHVNRFQEVHRQLATIKAQQAQDRSRGRNTPFNDFSHGTFNLIPRAQEIRAARVAMGWTQAKVAEEIGCSPAFIAHVETARCKAGEYETPLFELLKIQP